MEFRWNTLNPFTLEPKPLAGCIAVAINLLGPYIIYSGVKLISAGNYRAGITFALTALAGMAGPPAIAYVMNTKEQTLGVNNG